ncbi:MAG: hypothetical protein M1351_08735 [Candidatus Thermoplasmatota archaeon]|jgi:hypothetical protein|nr:hypothetical protein [Candidatus Sysuiplasma jiujiangense]MCL5254152.1 hypothetical protein [Candidatus Thermoplasmatota archaeon]
MKTGYRALIGAIVAILVLAAAGAIHLEAYLSILIASLLAGAIVSERVRIASAFSMALVFSILSLAALLYWQHLFVSFPFLEIPFTVTISPYIAASGSSQEIFQLGYEIAVTLLGGTIGAVATHFFIDILKKQGNAAESGETEIDRLSKKLEMLTKEREKLEEELRVCEMIEQGAKTRIAKNEITQNDYESIIYRNDNYRMKLKGRMEKVNSEIQQLRVDIEARQKAVAGTGFSKGPAKTG